MKPNPLSNFTLRTLVALILFSVAWKNGNTHEWGHDFLLTASGSAVISASPYSARFTAARTMTVTGATITINSVIGAPALTLGLQDDDGTGRATGTWLSSGTAAPSGSGDWSFDFGSGVPLNSGSVYHMVISNATPGASVLWLRFTGLNSNQPGSYYPDPKWGIGAAATASTFAAYNGVYLLRTTGDRNYGNPFGATKLSSIYSNTIYGQRFTYQGAGSELAVGVKMTFYVGATLPHDDLHVALMTPTKTLLASGTVSAASMSPMTSTNLTISLSGAPLLTVGNEYLLVAWSHKSTNSQWQLIFNNTGKASLEWNSATFDGTNSYAIISTTSTNPIAGTYSKYGDQYDARFILQTETLPKGVIFMGH